ncbi:cell surface protein [Pedobacter sp. PLR]|uniref:cell surface protein n=1 Tax=Pedobacter sp. PLR TaxID=2994465 RepID=UPI0022457F6A|nr:cell surface protein [Pedobacter sp. PLR]MCX2449903.1 cell surface protein [Pedobacter sp. PLR]
MKIKYYLAFIGIATLASCSKDSDPAPEPIPIVGTSFVSKLIEYLPAPGQFINESLGSIEGANSVIGKKGLVSLGAWGGSIVLGFDHMVINQADKDDIIIYGNPLPEFAEPGIVWVMQDTNGNGLADDTWYEVAGSEFSKPSYKRGYAVTYTKPAADADPVPWKDSDGLTGVVETNTFHRQAYFPVMKDKDGKLITEYTLKGSKLPSTNINMTVPTMITSVPFAWGYADNTFGGDKVDIANAVDQAGKKVVLKGINFIKIQTGVQANMGWLGELSTEVVGVEDISLIKVAP